MKRFAILILTTVLAANVFANIPSGTTIYLDCSQHWCCYATYMLRSDDLGICKKMTPVPGVAGLYSYKVPRSIGNNLIFAATDEVFTSTDINRNYGDFDNFRTTFGSTATPYCIVKENGCEWAAEPLAQAGTGIEEAQLNLVYNCATESYSANVFVRFEGRPCALKISSLLMDKAKIVKAPVSPYSFDLPLEVANGQTVTATVGIYSDKTATALLEERPLTATATGTDCAQTRSLTFCQNDKAVLTASVAGELYEWVSDDPEINGATTRSVTISTENLGQYHYACTTYQTNIVAENNLMAGGDFEREGIGFSSEYSYAGMNIVNYDYAGGGNNVYTLTQNVSTFWRDFASITPHTGQYYGFFDANDHGYAWKAETMSSTGNHNQDNPNLIIQAGKQYYFSYWTAFPNKEESQFFNGITATLQFKIAYTDATTGERHELNLGEPYTLTNEDHEWHQQSIVWTAPANSADVMIGVYDEESDWHGNDFCLDDIMFQTVSTAESKVAFVDQFEVTIRTCGTEPERECPEVIEETTDKTIYAQELPFVWSWQDEPIEQAGQYVVIERTTDGQCDSVKHILNLEVVECEVEVYKKWNDFLFVNNAQAQYTTYQWYRNGEPIEGANAQYYRADEVDEAVYYVVINDTIRSCETTLQEATLSAPLNPAPNNQAVIATKVYVVSPTFQIVTTIYEDGTTQSVKQVIL